MSEKRLPYGRQWVDDADVAEVVRVLRSDYLTTGPTVESFERELAGYCGVAHAVAVNSGTSALHAAYFAAGLAPGDEILTSPLTFAATANAALYLDGGIRFVDVDPATGNLDPDRLEAAIGERTRLIVTVDFGGHPADYDAIREIARQHRLKVVADAAHSLGGVYRGRKVGTLADLTATSFHPVKPITTAEGGAVLSDLEEAGRLAARFRNHGIVWGASDEQPEPGAWYYEMRHLGFNYRLSALHCALGMSQLRRLDAFVQRRREIAARYTKAFGGMAELILPIEREDVQSTWHLYVVQVAGDSRRRRVFFDNLRRRGLGVQVHYIPVYFHPYYRRLGFEEGLCPAAEERYARSVSLPIFPAMTDADVELVIDRVCQAVEEEL